ncbi:HNH endonuclease signature motif containing protein [Methanoculleus sp.]|uniref:HNH endonuclease signature motif containing protein n=1 Tax=Methanoculleus sp. TaxID=90427 RepID=UPI002FCA3681
MGINEAKIESYVNQLFTGEKKRVDAGERKKKERISPEDSQGKEIVRRCNAKCDGCDLPYTDPHKFNIHHIDGDPSNPLTPNLTLLCSNCHNTIHGRVNNQIKNYRLTQKQTGAGKTNVRKAPAKPKTIKVKCGFCKGSGKGLTGLYECPICHGEKEINVYDPPEKCKPCNGTGKDLPLSTMCPKCHGTGYRNTVPAKSIRSRKY